MGTRYPRLVTRSYLAWMLGTYLVCVGIGVQVAVTQPENRPYVYGGLAALTIAAVLIALVDTIAARTRPTVSGQAVALLRAQAKHLAAGGDAASSPLAAFTSTGLITAAVTRS